MDRRRPAALAAALLLTACGSDPPAPAAPAPTPTLPPTSTVDSPIGLAGAGGAVWVASADQDAVLRVDPGTGQVTRTVPVGDTPLRLVADGDLVWVTVFRDGRLRAIDATTGAVVRDIAAADGPEGVATGFDRLWLVRQDAGQLTALDRRGAARRDYPVPGTPRLVTTSASYVWVSSYRGGTVTRIEPVSGRVTTSPRLCEGAQGMAAGAGVLWLTCTSGGEVLAVDEETLAVRGRVTVDGEPDAVRVVAGRVFVLATRGPTLVELAADPAAPAVLRRQPLGDQPALADQANVELIAVGDRLWASSVRGDALYSIPLP